MTSPPLDSAIDPLPVRPPVRYRAVHPAAVASLTLGGLSALAFFGWLFGVIPLAAIVLGWRALRRIERTPEEYTGPALAWSGIGLGAALWIAGCGWLWFGPGNEVPIGYEAVEYAKLQPDPTVPGERVPPAILKLDGKKIYVKGYMVPGRQQVRLRRFQLCPTNGVCTFCQPNPKPTEIIVVELTSDLVANYTTHLIGLGGKFHVDPDAPAGLPYSMEADRLRD